MAFIFQALKAQATASEPRNNGPQLFKKRQYQERQAAANDPPSKIQRTGGTPEPSTDSLTRFVEYFFLRIFCVPNTLALPFKLKDVMDKLLVGLGQ